MHSDERALLNAVLANRDDDAPRLVYADWLDDHAKMVDCKTCNRVGHMGPYNTADERQFGKFCSACGGSGSASNGKAERAEFIRIQIELAKLRGRTDSIGRKIGHTRAKLIRPLSDRERELFNAHDVQWFPLGSSFPSRGFVSYLKLSAADCLAHLDAIIAEHPIEEVELTTVPEIEDRGEFFRLRGHHERIPSGIIDSLYAPDTLPLLCLRYCFQGIRFTLPEPEVTTHYDYSLERRWRAGMITERGLAGWPGSTPPPQSPHDSATPSAE